MMTLAVSQALSMHLEAWNTTGSIACADRFVEVVRLAFEVPRCLPPTNAPGPDPTPLTHMAGTSTLTIAISKSTEMDNKTILTKQTNSLSTQTWLTSPCWRNLRQGLIHSLSLTSRISLLRPSLTKGPSSLRAHARKEVWTDEHFVHIYLANITLKAMKKLSLWIYLQGSGMHTLTSTLPSRLPMNACLHWTKQLTRSSTMGLNRCYTLCYAAHYKYNAGKAL